VRSVYQCIYERRVVFTCRVSPPKLIHDTRLIVAYNGDVLWTSHVRYQLTCVTWSQRDDVECQLRFGSWTLGAELLRLQTVDQSAGDDPLRPAAGDFYARNSDWELTSTTVATHDVEYPCCPGKKYGDVAYSLRMRPRSSGLREVRSGNQLPAESPGPTNAEGSSPSSGLRHSHLRTTCFNRVIPLFVACVTWSSHVMLRTSLSSC